MGVATIAVPTYGIDAPAHQARVPRSRQSRVERPRARRCTLSGNCTTTALPKNHSLACYIRSRGKLLTMHSEIAKLPAVIALDALDPKCRIHASAPGSAEQIGRAHV